MLQAEGWWGNLPEERFWLESTDRADIGDDLRAPLADEGGRENWRYTLFRQASVGDIVFHYDKGVGAITSLSRIAGAPIDHPIIWAARGSYARDRHAQPAEVPGYRIPLDRHQALDPPVTLNDLRQASTTIAGLHDELLARHGCPLYFPFELADRPIRPLQGYAFKLPLAFVDAFPKLRSAAALPSGLAPLTVVPGDPFRRAVLDIEAAAPGFRIAELQADRSRRLGLKRIAKTLFGSRVQAPDWAYHFGGRQELQFNLGVDSFSDGAAAFRAGVAFSFETSRSLPDISVLAPKVARFNAWLREHPEAVEQLSMWHWKDGQRSEDYAPSPIPAGLMQPNTFVFLGQRQPLGDVDARSALSALDGLYPLYTWVETADATPVTSDARERPTELDLDNGRRLDGGRWILASTPERVLNIYLRHREIQRRLVEQLKSEGCRRVGAEVALSQGLIDVAAEHPDGLWFYEIKTNPTVKGCLREAVGQLLEYALWPGNHKPVRLVVVGEAPLDATSKVYLDTLNAAFPIPIAYRRLGLNNDGPSPVANEDLSFG